MAHWDKSGTWQTSAVFILQNRYCSRVSLRMPRRRTYQTHGSATINSFHRVFYAEVLPVPAVEPFSYTGTAIPPFPLVQSASLPFEAAFGPTLAVEYSTPHISESRPTAALLWPYGMSVMEPHQSPCSVGLGIVGLWPTASSCPCVGLSTGQICAHQLFSSVAWVSYSRSNQSLGFTSLMICTW